MKQNTCEHATREKSRYKLHAKFNRNTDHLFKNIFHLHHASIKKYEMKHMQSCHAKKKKVHK